MNSQNFSVLIQNSGNCNGSDSISKKNINKERKYLSKFEVLNNEMSHTNGLSTNKYSVYNDRYFSPEINKEQLKPLPRKNILHKEKSQNGNIPNFLITKDDDRQMPKLKKENDIDSGAHLQFNSDILNQRYQNTLRFPNYRQRKKLAFENKLRRSGVEIDGEVTVGNLRKFLQPYIYNEINNILDRYIEVYFKKAIKHIQENVNLTSENWSETLKCSISKSLYKQYCDKANFEPFTSTSITEDDFQYFKTSEKINHKINNIHVDHFVKSEIDNSTGHTSDSNSRCSYYTTNEEKLGIDNNLHAAEISSSSENQSEYNNDHVNRTADRRLRRKRKNQQVYRVDMDSSPSHPKLNETCSVRKYSKIIYPQSNDPYLSYNNNSDSLISQKRKESCLPRTAEFKNNGQSYFVARKPSEHSLNETDAERYLNTLNSKTSNLTNDHVHPSTYNCRQL